MNLKDARENYYFHSGKTSELVRQFGFAAVAIVWIFKSEVFGVQAIPKQLLMPLGFVVLGLGLDFLQYIVATAIWGIFHRIKEKQTGEDDEFTAPPAINWPAITFFWLKVAAIAAAYGLLLKFLVANIVAR